MTKRWIGALCGAALLLSLCGCSGTTASEKTDKIDFLTPSTTMNDPYGIDYQVMAQTEDLSLAINPDTTDVAVTVKKTGYTFGTANRKEADTADYPLVYLNYNTDDGSAGVLDSTNACVNKGQFKIDPIQNGVKVAYTLGEIAVDYIFPTSLTPERYEYWYDKCQNDDQKFTLEITYTKININDFDEVTQEQYRKDYPGAVNGEIYKLRNTTITDAEKNEISRVLADIGYTVEDLATDNTEYTPNKSVSAAFNVTVYYTLEGDRLTVRVPASEIRYDDNFHIQYLTVLQNFVGKQKNGYFLLPDGSGSLMYYCNGRDEQTDYRLPLYGSEKTVTYDNEINNAQNACLPLYGCVEGKNGYLAVVENGAALAYVNAYPGSAERNARAWLDFKVETHDYDALTNSITVFDDMKLSVYEKDRYSGDFTVQYTFFSGSEANYTHMAQYYSRELFAGSDRHAAAGAYPLSAECVGTVDVQKQLLGFTYSKQELLTDFAAMQKIAEDLLDTGVEALDLRVSGWFGNGYRNGTLGGSLNAAGQMGGNAALEKLVTTLRAKRVPVSLEADPQYAYEGAGSAGGAKVARFVNGTKAMRRYYNPDTFAVNQQKNGWYILSPAEIGAGIRNLAQRAKGVKADGITLRGFGTDLNADYNEKNEVDRQRALEQHRKLLTELSGTCALTVEGSNAYVYPAASRILNFPVISNRQDQTDVSVPFLAMVVSGHADYVSAPLNLSNATRLQLLRIIESNAGANAVFTDATCAGMEVQEYRNLYATRYADQKQVVTEAYAYLKGALSDTYGQPIVGHTVLQEGVSKVDFANGKWLIVNYTDTAVTVGGVNVPAQDYVKGGGDF